MPRRRSGTAKRRNRGGHSVAERGSGPTWRCGVVRTGRLWVDGTYGPLVAGGRVGEHDRSPEIVEADCRPTRSRHRATGDPHASSARRRLARRPDRRQRSGARRSGRTRAGPDRGSGTQRVHRNRPSSRPRHRPTSRLRPPTARRARGDHRPRRDHRAEPGPGGLGAWRRSADLVRRPEPDRRPRPRPRPPISPTAPPIPPAATSSSSIATRTPRPPSSATGHGTGSAPRPASAPRSVATPRSSPSSSAAPS